MWIVAGVLLGLVVVGVLAGLHAGPHAHAAAAIVGVVAAVWLVVMAFLGEAKPLLYVLLGADLTMTGLVGFGAWRALAGGSARAQGAGSQHSVEGAYGTALEPLDPEGVVRVRGEDWSAVSLNGPVAAGGRVQVISVRGVRLEVWGETDPLAVRPADPVEKRRTP